MAVRHAHRHATAVEVLEMLLIVAILGLIIPNGLYLSWVLTRFDSVGAALNNELAVGFLIESIIATMLVAYRFHVSPLGKVRIHWFIILSLVGGVGFGIPAFYWLNKRTRAKKFAEIRKEVTRRRFHEFAVSQA